MKKLITLTFLLVAFGLSASAQYGLSRFTFGGGLGLQFGNYTLINIAPQVGYNVNSYFNVGVGVTYTHFNQKYDTERHKQNYLGLNVYGRFYPTSFLVLMIQPEINRMWRTVENRRSGATYSDDKIVPVCLVGGGLRFGPVTAMLKYDIAQNSSSPYGTRLFYSVGYTFGF